MTFSKTNPKPAAISYRNAGREDAAAIFSLLHELAAYEKMLDDFTTTEEQLAELLFGKTGMARYVCQMAEQDGEPVGVCIAFYTLSTFQGKPGLYVEDVYVRESCRGRGVGTGFFREMAQRALTEGCCRVDWSVLDWNKPSIEFYERLGAKAQKEWLRYRLDMDGIRAVANG